MNCDFRIYDKVNKCYSSSYNLKQIVENNYCHTLFNDDFNLIHEPFIGLKDCEQNKIYFNDVLKSNLNKNYYVDFDSELASFILIEVGGDADEALSASIGNVDCLELKVIGRYDNGKILK